MWTRIKFMVFGGLVIAIIVLIQALANMKQENMRQEENIRQITQEGARQLMLSKSEFRIINAKWKTTLDSVMKANDIKLRNVKAATVVHTEYRDTGSVKIEYKPVYIRDSMCVIQVSNEDKCWGIKGEIVSKDPLATFNILERSAFNSVQIIVTEKKRFIFWKKRSYQAFSDCGEVDVTDIKIQ